MVNAVLSSAAFDLGMLRTASFAAFAAVLLAAAPARAEILDIQAETTDTGLRILFVFDHQPADASITVSGSEAQATIAGARATGRMLRPSGDLRQISVAERPLGLSVGAVTARPILGGAATVYRNSVLFELTLMTGPQTPPAAAPAPQPQPAQSPDLTQMAQDAALQEATSELASAAFGSGDAFADMALAEAMGVRLPAPPAAAPAPAPAEAPSATDSPETAAPAPQVAPEAAPQPEPEVEPQLEPQPAPVAVAEAAPPPPEPPAPDPARRIALPDWAQDPAEFELTRAPLPQPGAPPGAAAELLAAQLDRAACDRAAARVDADPWAMDALYDHGACLARAGQTARAREVFERMSTFDPGSPRALVGLGVLRQDAGDRAGAQQLYDRALANSVEDGLAVLVRMLGEL